MSCNFPIRAYQGTDGSVFFYERQGRDPVRSLELPCGQCAGCRLARASAWAVRCVHEAQMWPTSSFVTLTYRTESLPTGMSLCYPDFQFFMRRLRKRLSGRIRFFMCGEYGDVTSRPHYHACLFNCHFDDRVLFSHSADGSRLYRSDLLDELWRHGHCTVGDVTLASAGYVARYVMKKELGVDAGPRRCLLDVTTGELVERDHEFCHMSLKPGIGKTWLEKFHRDVYPLGKVVVDGVELPAPKYYDKWFRKVGPGGEVEALEFRRALEARSRAADNTYSRLEVKEQVLRARVSFLKRGLG